MAARIVVEPTVHFGKPCLASTRIPVVAVLELIGEGITFDTILRDYYPDLELADIQACIQHAIEITDAEEIHVGIAS